MAGFTGTWAHAGYADEAYGSAAYRSELALHIKEVSERQALGSYTVNGKTHSIDLNGYLRELMQLQRALNDQPVTPSVTDTDERTYFSRGVPL